MFTTANLAFFCRALASRSSELIRRDAGLYLAIVVYTLLGLSFVVAVGAQEQTAYWAYVRRWPIAFGVLLPAIALFVDCCLIIHRFDRRRELAMKRVFSVERMARFVAGIALLLAMLLFQGTFTSVKNALPIWHHGFLYDRVLADVDRDLHFGVDPWQWLYALAGYDPVRIFVGWNYNVLWSITSFSTLFFVVTSPRAQSIRLRYLVCFMLTWVLVGNLLAGQFISAGPAFYGLVTGDTMRFAGQHAFLAHGLTSPSSAINYQSYLWELYRSHQAGFASGISAFPSVHVATATLNALFLAEYSRRLGTAAFAYVAFITASSVYLGWHYAIDGYVAVAVVVIVHLALRKAFALWHTRAPRAAPSIDAVAPAYNFLIATSTTR